MSRVRHEGQCHCGAVRVSLQSARGLDDLPVRACGCGHCAPQRARYTSDPAGHATVEVGAGPPLGSYRFGTGTAEFLRCGRCGVLLAAACRIDARAVAVLSAGLFAGLRDRAAAPADFDGEPLDERLARRARSWTPVTIAEARAADPARGRIRRGELYWLPSSPAGIPHPHLVLQEDVFNDSRVDSVIVCALTSNPRRGTEPGNVRLDAGEGSLPSASVVVVSQIAAVPRAALGARIGRLSEARVREAIAGLGFQQRSSRGGHDDEPR